MEQSSVRDEYALRDAYTHFEMWSAECYWHHKTLGDGDNARM